MKTNLLLLKSSLLRTSGVFKAAFLLLVLLLIGTATRAQVVYSMGEPGNTSAAIAGDLIKKMNYDGTNVSTVITGANAGLIQPFAVALDGNNNRIFVSEGNLSGNVIKVITGSSVTSTITSANSAYIKDINYDVVGNWLYYITESGDITQVAANDALYRVHPDGTGLQTLATSITKNPYRLEVDAANNKVYVVDVSFSGRSIKTVDLANSNAVTSRAFATSLNSVYDVALDKVTGYLYYCAEGGSAATLSATDQVRRQNIDGTNDVQIAASVCNSPFRLGLDAGNNRLYVGDAYYGTGKIVAINLTNNTFSTTLNFTTGQNTPQIYDFGVPDRPTVTTAAASSVVATSATLGGTLVYGYGLSTERGVVYSSTNSTPTVSDTKAANATVTTNGAYSASVTGLSASTTYYARAYAINGAGTTYGAVVSFTTLSNDANLSAFTISSGTLNPTFAAGTITYTASVTNATTGVTVTPTVNQGSATVKVNGTAVTSGSASGNIGLSIGANTVTTIVTAQDGSTTKTYTTTVTRAKTAQTTAFASTNTKTYGDADYAPGATASSGLTVSYASSNTAVATIVSGQIHIVGAGTTNITASQAGDATYLAATDVVQALTVNKNAITVTATAGQTKVYGNADPTYAYTVTTGTVKAGDTFSGALTRAAGSDVGAYAITIGTLALNTSNYTVTLSSNNFSITKRPLEITPTVQTKVYGDNDPASYTYNFTSGTSTAIGDGMTGVFVRAAGETVGTYAFSIGTKHPANTTNGADASANYNVSFVSTNLTITKRPLNISPLPVTKVYGTTDFANGAPYNLNGTTPAPNDGMTGLFGRDNASENVGVYNLTLGFKHPVNASTGIDQSANYTITFVSNTFTITAKPVTVTANAQTKIYGDADPALTYNTNTGLAYSDSFTGALSRTAGENFGTYAINQNTLALSSNYTLTFTGNNLTIGKKTINVTADAKTKTFGDSDPALTYTADALAGGDSFSGALTRAAGESFGNYAISQGTLAVTNSSNYILNFTGANLTIDKKIINVTAAAKTKTYGDSDPALTYTADALSGSDSFTGALTRVAGETSGTYAINQGTLALNSNYTLNYAGANLSIGKRAIDIYSGSRDVPYGEPDGTIGYSYSGTPVSGDTFSGTLGREAGTALGTYATTIGTFQISNGGSYDLIFHSAPFNIIQREIVVTGGSTIKMYGDPDPAINYSIYSGTLLGGTQITGALERVAGETAGPYNVGQGTLAINDPNYKLTYQGGYFEIDRAPLTFTIDNKTKVATKPNPALTYSLTGFKNGDTEATTFTPAIQLTTDASISSAAGDYNIYPVGSVTAVNYNITQVGGTLTVTPASSINTLASATLNGGGFNEAFDPATDFYSVSIPNGSTSATLIVNVTDPLSSITVGYDPATATALASGAPYIISISNNNSEQVPVNVKAEDGTVHSYYFNVNPIPSDSKLSNLVTSVGIISPSFSPLVTSYTLNVSAETDSVTITPTTHDPLATARVSGGGEGGATGAKKIAVREGGNPINISVRSADNTGNTFYQLYIKRPIRLKTLAISAGNLFPAFDPNVTSYVAKVGEGIPAITVTPEGNESYYQITVNGEYLSSGNASGPITINEDGSTTIAVTITAGDGETTKTYTINVVPGSSNADLAGISVSGGALDPAFDPATSTYHVYLPNAVTSVAFTPTLADAGASMSINSEPTASGTTISESNIPVGMRNYYIATLAGDGTTTKTYTLSITRAPSSEPGLSNILLSQGTLSPAFDQAMYNTYDVVVPNTVTSVDVTPVLIDTTASISARFNGHNVALPTGVITVAPNVGVNSLIISSTAQDGTTSAITSVIIKRLGDPNLSNLAVSTPGTFSPAFNSNTYAYTASVAYAASTYALTPTALDPNAVIKVKGNTVASDAETSVSLAEGDNTVNIEVTAPDGASKTYTIVVNRAAPSTDNTLVSLTPSTGNFLFAFNNSNGYYPIVLPGSVNAITVTPVANDAKASILVDYQTVLSGMASQPLATGHFYQIRVIAENGDTRFFTLDVKNASTNANLYRLETTAGPLSPVFNRDVTSYSLTVPTSVSSTGITAQLADSTARVSINGEPKQHGYYEHNVPLAYGNNTIQVAVSPQEGGDKVYTITITRTPQSANALLSQIVTSPYATISNTTGTADYNRTVSVTADVNSITVTPTAADAGATIKVAGTAVNSGEASATIALTGNTTVVLMEVTAADGTTVKTYSLTVNKLAATSALLTQIVSNPYATLRTAADGPADFNRTLTVNTTVSSVTLTPTAADPNATIKIDGNVVASGAESGAIALALGSTKVVHIEVTAASGGTVKTYSVSITRPLSSNAVLTKIVSSPFATLTTITGPADFNRAISLASTATAVTFKATAADAGATIRVNGQVVASGAASQSIPLPLLTTLVNIEVTAPDSVTKKVYAITVNRAPRTNAILSKILFNPSASITTTTGPADYNRNALVPANTVKVTVAATSADAAATIKINGVTTLSGRASGNIVLNTDATPTPVTIVVTAEDGVTTKTYAIAVNKQAPPVIAAIVGQPKTIEVVQRSERPSTADAQADELSVRQAVSPNGDGINDRFTIDGINAFPENTVKVMNRNGDVIYEAKGYDNESKAFDGHSSKGTLQQAGTYFYSVEYKKGDETKRKTGYIIIKY
jgi:gliding motility-associated-like protein